MKTMIVAKVIFFLTIIVEFSEPFRRDTVTVKTSLGSIRGLRMKSRERRDFVAFRGIRYAESPTGENRFRPPVPVKNWSGVYDATKDGDICIQSTPLLTRASTQSEDCLILNVYTPNIRGNRTVLFYIHGGSNIGGSSHSIHSAGPQYLMDKDIVLVTINYRLGPLGFLSTGTEDSPGNYAFKDQVLALRWVHDHIRSFGGDPDSVTIAGQSAGGFAVTLHMISPMSQGLFRRAIAMSGNEPNYAYVDNISWTKKLAQNVSCPDDNPKLLVECLRNTPTDCILEVIESWENVELPNLKWNYEIEGDFGQERFIIEDPLKTYVKGEFARIPILTGITKDEFGPYAYYVYQKQELLDRFNENFTEIAPSVFVYKNGTKQSDEISRTLRKFYLNDEKIDDSNFDNLMELFTDAIIVHGVHRFVSLTRRYTDVYYYRTDFMGRYSNVYDDNRKPIVIYHHKPEILQKFNQNFNEIAPQIFAYEQGTEKSLNISRTLRKFYLNDEIIDESNLDRFGALIADGFIGHGVHRFVELARRYTDVYYYRTDFMGRYSHITKLDGKPVGVCHSDDRAYLFVYNKFAPMFTKTDPENIMVERYTTWWTTFAKTGNPNDNTNKYTASIEWNPSNATTLRTLYIDTECREDTEPYQDRLRVWDELFPIPYQ